VEAFEKMINGVKIKKIILNTDERGDFREILRVNEGLVDRIQQVSIGRTLPGIIKAFHWHKNQEDVFYVSRGNIQLVLYDPRENSPTRGLIQEILLGESHEPQAVLIPRRVLHGYQTIGIKEAEVVYIMNNTYDPLNPDEERVAHDNPSIGFDWAKIKRGMK
jgi:dTDP-4-dehydrorhamnose 3,5-epimerase